MSFNDLALIRDTCHVRLPALPALSFALAHSRPASLQSRFMVSASASSRILQPNTYKDRMLSMWQGREKSYDESDTFHEALALKLVDLAKLRSGQDVLDVATGTGMVALPVCKLLGQMGRLVGIDISAGMVNEVL